jgi:hypothetical protein
MVKISFKKMFPFILCVKNIEGEWETGGQEFLSPLSYILGFFEGKISTILKHILHNK